MPRPDGGGRGNVPLTEAALDNGLRVLVAQAEADVAAVHLWIECGSLDESAADSGLAHFLEHMVFKGTAERGIGGSAAAIEALGGELEAFTSEDHTEIEATVEAGGWAEALAVVADLVRSPRLDPEEVAREIPVVLEEIRADLDDPDALAAEAVDRLLYAEHPYARSILGTSATVAGFTAARTRAFWERGWVAGRTWLAVVGPVDAAAVVATARRLFGGQARGEPRGAPPVPGPRPAARATASARRSLETTAVELGWRLPLPDHPDRVALDVAAGLLGHGSGALLPVRLQIDAGLAAGVWSEATWRIAGGRFGCGWIPTAEDAVESVREALAEVDAVARGRTPGRLLAQARDLMAADLRFAHETVEGRASDLLWYRVRTGDAEGAEQWRRAVAATTPDDVRRATARWLRADEAVVAAVGPDVKRRDLERALTSAPTAPVAARGRVDRVLEHGLRVVVAHDASPVAAVRVLGRGGGWIETARTAGSARAWARMVTAGAADLDTVGFAETTDALGGVIEAHSGRSTAGISASFPSENLLDGLGLLADVLVAPTFAAESWERVQGELQEEVETLPDEPDELAWERIWGALWPGHPWRLPAGGTVASLAAITPHRLREVHEGWARGGNLVIAVAGGCDPSAVIDALGPVAAGLPDGPAARPSATPGEPARGEREIRAGHAQAHVWCAVRTPGLEAGHRTALELGTAILTAQAGRLFVALREVRSLAYSVSAELALEEGGGVFAAGLATGPARADEACEVLRAELARFASDGPTDEELDRARRQSLGFLAAALQRSASRAGDLASNLVFGLPSGLDGHRRALAAVSRAEVREAFAALGLDDPLRVIVRPR